MYMRRWMVIEVDHPKYIRAPISLYTTYHLFLHYSTLFFFYINENRIEAPSSISLYTTYHLPTLHYFTLFFYINENRSPIVHSG